MKKENKNKCGKDGRNTNKCRGGWRLPSGVEKKASGRILGVEFSNLGFAQIRRGAGEVEEGEDKENTKEISDGINKRIA